MELGKSPVQTQVMDDGTVGMAHMVVLNLQDAGIRTTVRNMLKTDMDPILLWNPNYYARKEE